MRVELKLEKHSIFIVSDAVPHVGDFVYLPNEPRPYIVDRVNWLIEPSAKKGNDPIQEVQVELLLTID